MTPTVAAELADEALVDVTDIMDTSHVVFLLPHQLGVVIRERPVPVVRITQGRAGYTITGKDHARCCLTGFEVSLTGPQVIGAGGQLFQAQGQPPFSCLSLAHT
jgi:hypothetical protein